MLKAPGRFAQICHCYGCAEYLLDAKWVLWPWNPPGETETAFFPCAIVLDEEGIVLREIGTLDIGAQPASYPSTCGHKLSWDWSEHRDPSIGHGCTISRDVVGRKDEIQVTITLSQ